MTRVEVLVADAGFSGATDPRVLAEAGWRVYVIDRR
jgi:UDP-galactopyranose mutase